MRIAAFSDIHGNLNGFNAVLEDIERRGGADILVAAGDLVTDGPRPVETFDRLIEANCLMIRGNHDQYLLGQDYEMIKPETREHVWQQAQWATGQFGSQRLALMEQQPFQRTFSPAPHIKNHDIIFVHANLKSAHGFTGHSGQSEEALAELYGDAPAGTEIIAFGHWHACSVRRWRGIRLVNIASIAYPKDLAKLAGYTLFDWDNFSQSWHIEQHRVAFDWREEAQLLRESDLPGPLWQLDKYYTEDEASEIAA